MVVALPPRSTVTTLVREAPGLGMEHFLNCSHLLFHYFYYKFKILIMVPPFSDQIKMHFFAHHLADHLDTLPPCYLKHGVKLVDPSSLTDLPPNTLINVHVRVVGGKGGFGSLLRAIGSQIERTTDQNSKRFYFIVQLDKITRVKKSRRSTPARYRTREDGRRATQTEN